MAPRGCAARGKSRSRMPGEARDYRADHVILATGARPRALPGIEPDGERYLDLFRGAAA
jgi:pyruvate/2-oxoglutarate dehydrogenase complex dihydrolipoamide dehydrogenase (E3) component